MAARNAQTNRRDELVRLLEPVVARLGYDLEDLSVVAAGRRSVIRVVIDSDSGVDLDAVAEVARGVSDCLDTETAGVAAFAGPYVLEVSSPGTDRLLTEPRHWRRAAGRLVSTSADGSSLRGRVTGVSESAVTFDVAGTAVEVGIAELGPGRIELEFNRPGGESNGDLVDGDESNADKSDGDESDGDESDDHESDEHELDDHELDGDELAEYQADGGEAAPYVTDVSQGKD